ncbi:MAG: hypothetical protein EP330_09725 [Deltaproteobacteria bacterium]|nr:MAG: hypothetical protein EP330_09725 [Deltaproteobacteria bacterium]
MSRVHAVWAVALAGLTLPGVAEACAVCFSATESNRGAFIGTTVFLTILPLLMIGSVAFYVYRRVKEMEATEPGA